MRTIKRYVICNAFDASFSNKQAERITANFSIKLCNIYANIFIQYRCSWLHPLTPAILCAVQGLGTAPPIEGTSGLPLPPPAIFGAAGPSSVSTFNHALHHQLLNFQSYNLFTLWVASTPCAGDVELCNTFAIIFNQYRCLRLLIVDSVSIDRLTAFVYRCGAH